MSTSNTCLVVGATGLVGAAVAHRLRKLGCEVPAVVRDDLERPAARALSEGGVRRWQATSVTRLPSPGRARTYTRSYAPRRRCRTRAATLCSRSITTASSRSSQRPNRRASVGSSIPRIPGTSGPTRRWHGRNAPARRASPTVPWKVQFCGRLSSCRSGSARTWDSTPGKGGLESSAMDRRQSVTCLPAMSRPLPSRRQSAMASFVRSSISAVRTRSRNSRPLPSLSASVARRFEREHVPMTALEDQHRSPDPLQRTFSRDSFDRLRTWSTPCRRRNGSHCTTAYG